MNESRKQITREIVLQFIGGGSDDLCPDSHLVKINQNPSSQKFIIDGANHNFTNKENELLNMVDAFIADI